MSERLRTAFLFTGILIVMTMMLNFAVSTSETYESGRAEWAGILIVILALASLMFLIAVVLTWRDPFVKKTRSVGRPIWYYVVWGLSGMGAVLLVKYFGEVGRAGIVLLNSTVNNTTVNGSAVPPSPVYHNGTVTQIPAREALPFQYVLYSLLVVFIAVFLFTGFKLYKVLMEKKKREEMKLKAELFEKRLNELGLEMFEDPREAIVGIYKNAVLWLEYLGLPYKESWTHWEHAERVKYMHEAFVELTKLFEKAKYAPEKLTWDDAERALSFYRKMRRGIDEIR